MNKTLFYALALIMSVLMACSSKNVATGLDGSKYKVDLSDAENVVKSELKLEDVANQMIGSVLDQLDLTVKFENNTVEFNISKTVSMLLGAMTKEKFTFPYTCDYKIENDTILYLKDKTGEFKNTGTLKLKDNSFDNLIFVPKSNQYNIEIPLVREK